MIQREPECLARDGCCETPPSLLPRGSATPPKCGPANSEADSGQPTSTRTDYPILDLHELMSRRVEHFAVIQAEMIEVARLTEVGNKLRRQAETCRFFLGGQEHWQPTGAEREGAQRGEKANSDKAAVRRLMLSWLRPAAARVKRAGAVASTAAASATVAAAGGGSSSAEDGM